MKLKTLYLYPEENDVRLDCYLLDDSKELLSGKPRPSVIICPGGAYTFLSDREAEPIALKFCSLGYHAFILRYTTINGQANAWPEDVYQLPKTDPRTIYPNPVLQLGKAMLAIREHAEEWLVDPDKIGISGYSAGGHNCAMYSGLWHEAFVYEALKTRPENLRPAFCILGYPFIDFLYNSTYPFDEFTRAAYKWMSIDYFGHADPTEEEMQNAGAHNHVSDKNPPTFIWNTSTDAGVPVMHTLKMACALAEHKVPFELHVFGEGQHGLALADPSTAADPSQINDTVRSWIPLAIRWLEKNAPLPIG